MTNGAIRGWIQGLLADALNVRVRQPNNGQHAMCFACHQTVEATRQCMAFSNKHRLVVSGIVALYTLAAASETLCIASYPQVQSSYMHQDAGHQCNSMLATGTHDQHSTVDATASCKSSCNLCKAVNMRELVFCWCYRHGHA